MDKVSITITTDKPVKISVTPNDESAAQQQDGLAKLLREVKEGDGHVVKRGENSQGTACKRTKP